MTDIVERLRGYANIAHAAAAWGFAGEGMTMEQAADEIEQLRAALEKIAAPCAVSATVNWRWMYEAWRALCVGRVDIARAALNKEEK